MSQNRLRALVVSAAATLATCVPPAHAAGAGAATCPSFPQGYGGSSQLVTVEPAQAPTFAKLTLWTRRGSCWVRAAGPWTARTGRNGLSSHHREGDGTTPIGAFGIEPVMYGLAPDPGVRYRYHRLVCGDWWDEDPTSPAYNRFQHVPCGAQPSFGGGSEALWRATTAYQSFAVLSYNADPVVPGRGSAIFVHATTGRATTGCVSLPLAELDRLLRWLDPALKPIVSIV